MKPGNGKNSPVADRQPDEVKRVQDNVEQLKALGYQSAFAEIGVDQPQWKRHRCENSQHPRGRDGPLERAVSEDGFIVERINDGSVTLHGYKDAVKCTHVGRQLYQKSETCGDHVPAARIAGEVDIDNVWIIADHTETGYEVGYQHARQDQVGLGPESGRHPNGYERKAVTAQVEYSQ